MQIYEAMKSTESIYHKTSKRYRIKLLLLTIVIVRAFDSQFQNESLSSKLQEELASREEVEHK